MTLMTTPAVPVVKVLTTANQAVKSSHKEVKNVVCHFSDSDRNYPYDHSLRPKKQDFQPEQVFPSASTECPKRQRGGEARCNSCADLY